MYDELIMEHIRNARNYRVLEDADRRVKGSNPLCGDELALYLKLDGERIDDVAFQCTCCGISMASASMMTEMVKGTSTNEARRIAADFVAMLEKAASAPEEPAAQERAAMLDTARKFPARARCAALPWATLADALAS